MNMSNYDIMMTISRVTDIESLQNVIQAAEVFMVNGFLDNDTYRRIVKHANDSIKRRMESQNKQ